MQTAFIALGFLAFAAIGAAATVVARGICARVPSLHDGPRSGTPPSALLVAGSGAVGGLIMMHGVAPIVLLLVALVVFGLCGSWYCDVARGIVPDVFSVLPLTVIIGAALVTRDWSVVLSAIVLFAPFAMSATLSRGLGMGWGDVKLVSLGGAVLGAQDGLVLIAIACFVAAMVHALRRSHGPIALAPYLAAAIAVGMPLAATIR